MKHQAAATPAHEPVAAYAAYEGALAVALDMVLAGDLVADLAGVERRVVGSLGALAWLVGLHRVDGRGRCQICRSHWWRRRSVCTVYRALILHVRLSGQRPPAAVAAGASTAGSRS